MIKLNDFVDKVYVITEINSVRNDYIKEHLAKHNIEYSFIVSPYANAYSPIRNLNIYEQSLLYANLSIFENAIINGYNKIAVLENDVHLVDDFEEKFSLFIEHVPPDVFIYNIEDPYDKNTPKYQLINDYCKRILSIRFGSVFLIYNSKKLLNIIKKSIISMAENNCLLPIDNITSMIYESLPCYCPNDILAYGLSEMIHPINKTPIKHSCADFVFPTVIH